jgi:hypothetical protein
VKRLIEKSDIFTFIVSRLRVPDKFISPRKIPSPRGERVRERG